MDKINIKETKGKKDFFRIPTEFEKELLNYPFDLENLNDIAIGIIGILEVMDYGAKKYSPGSWKKVNPIEFLKACRRHMQAIREGELLDSESGLAHWKHMLVNALYFGVLVDSKIKDMEHFKIDDSESDIKLTKKFQSERINEINKMILEQKSLKAYSGYMRNFYNIGVLPENIEGTKE